MEVEEGTAVINGDGKSNNINKSVVSFQSGNWANACQEGGRTLPLCTLYFKF